MHRDRGHAACTIRVYVHVCTLDFVPPIRLSLDKIKGETKRGEYVFRAEFHNTFLNRTTGIALHARFIMSFVRARANKEFTLRLLKEYALTRAESPKNRPTRHLRVAFLLI